MRLLRYLLSIILRILNSRMIFEFLLSWLLYLFAITLITQHEPRLDQAIAASVGIFFGFVLAALIEDRRAQQKHDSSRG